MSDTKRPAPTPSEPAGPATIPGPDSIEKRFALEQERIQRVIRWVTPLISVAIALLIGSVVILLSGGSPLEAYAALFQGSFGTQRAIGETLLRSTPLIFTGLAVAYGFRAGLFNIGAEGQLFLGGLAAAMVGVWMGGMSWWITLPTMIFAAMLFGAAWAFIPALMKARIGANEVITTMMFTYIGRYLVDWAVTGPLRAEGGIPQTREIGLGARLPQFHTLLPFLKPTRAHAGILVAIAAAVVIWLILKYTTIGYNARAVGFNRWAAEAGGVSVSRTIIMSLMISGALAGLAGASEVMGVYYRLFGSFSSGFGFTGIAVALLAKNNPLGVIPAAILFGALSAGAGTMQLEADVSQKVILIIQATIIFLVGAELIVTWTVDKIRTRRQVSPVAA